MPRISTLTDSNFGNSTLQVYNGLDCCVTLEVFQELKTLYNQDPDTYNFTRQLQAPALEMMLRGFKIDNFARKRAIMDLETEIGRLQHILDSYANAIWDKPLNANSPAQLKKFFYGIMALPEQFSIIKGERKVSTNREALEKLAAYFYATPIVETILAVRDRVKQKSVFETEIDPDSRMRTSYNICGTETGRWSSSSNAYGTGTNLQNIASKLRYPFIADDDKKLCGIDLEQAESREVGLKCGLLFDDWTYLNAAESGDLHTLTCKLIWKDLPWTGDPKADRKIADEIFYREFSYRDMSKRGGHGSNYLGTPVTMAKHLKVPTKLMRDFQDAYFAAFPAIPRWHRWVAQQLQTKQSLTTSFGRTRTFFGRANDDSTLREAIAFEPQSSTGDRLNLGLLNIWRELPQVQLIAQVHDALYFQYDPADEATIIPKALELIQIKQTFSGRTFLIPGEAKVGWNWGNFNDDEKKGRLNPDGLKKYKGPDARVRTPFLEQVF
jgi:DNA polymerase I-like protein with 3'-5' exonuclease and polymerase domains